MRPILIAPFAAALSLLGLAGCSTAPKVQTLTPGADHLASTGSYAWVPDRSGWGTNPLNNADVWRGAVRAAVEGELGRRGYTKAAVRSAGAVVAFHLVVRAEDGTVTVVDNYFGYDAPGIRTHLDAFVKSNAPKHGRQGTLVIDVADPAAKQLLWRGWATTELDPSLSPEARKQAIARLVAGILREFPERAR